MFGWLYCENMSCELLKGKAGYVEQYKNGILYTNLNNKFSEDTVKKENVFLEGYVLNVSELMESLQDRSWEQVIDHLKRSRAFPLELRGSFSGFYSEEGESSCFFTDHTGSKAIYYYINRKKLIVSSRLLWIMEILKENGVTYHFNELAAEYMLTYGYMIDESTFIKEVKRLLPGNKLTVNKEGFELIQYYMPTFKIEEGLSIDEAVERIDRSFRKAVQREFSKDQRNGYQHLVDLSGGLDSRMVTWVAHELGYVGQTNFSYCKADYLDFKIASNIAKDLKHEFFFKQLDDFNWIYSIDDILQMNNGAALYCGITGGASCLSNFNREKYGIEHTGMLGDVIISCFALTEKDAIARPNFGKNQYSEMLRFKFEEKLLDRYANQEIFDLYTRGFLGAMSTYPIRQNYFEVSSPFLDVDFMESCFSIPIKYRANHTVYLKWIDKYYKKASKYGWEKWGGVWPKEKLRLWKNGIFAVRKIKRSFRQLFGLKISDSMNPVDYWYSKDEKAQEFFEKYFRENINNICFSASIKQNMKKMFERGTVSEKAQVLTVLGIAKLYWPQ